MQRDGGLRGGQVDGLALILAGVSAALLLVIATSAWSAATGGGGWILQAPNSGVIASEGTDWGTLIRTLALGTSPLHVVLLGGSVALVGRRSWSAAGRPGHAAAVAVLVLGLVVALLAGLGTYFTAANDAGPGASFGSDAADRMAAATLLAITTAGGAYAAWCAFSLLPVASSPRGPAQATGAGENPDA